ncbi:alpha/beta fold hydrolase [Psychroserpens sp. SPM9]|uniref:alpha/beta fold hydrolase n=1 Tax=Psychroserpens sp. SPM9 TaxID=2975598 RepID=UPI0021A27784|nr:alpha/beta hydrolase [Psychroserpens sp. SPM9]MDG5491139.1 alpha/beta hydrolase [Psychroserpens sp. SPM9]
MKTIKNKMLFTFVVFSITLQAQTKAFEVEVKGQGDPILLFPGFTSTGDVWKDVVADLSKTYECHIFTFAGFGDVAPIETPWLPKIRNSISQYISHHKLDEATIIGHSLGGTLGLWLATEKNAKYTKVIVVDALPSTGALMMPNFNSETIVYDNPYNKRLLQMDAISFEAMATQMATAMSLNKDKHTLIRDWILKADRKTYVYGYTDLLKLDLRESISKITVPITVLAATEPYGKDLVTKTYETQYKNLKAYTIKFAEESAHFIMFDQPGWLLNRIKEELH